MYLKKRINSDNSGIQTTPPHGIHIYNLLTHTLNKIGKTQLLFCQKRQNETSENFK